MLDFQKLIPQIQNLGQDSLLKENEQSEILGAAQSSFENAATEEENFKLKLLENGGRTFWPLAIPLEPFGQSAPLESFREPYTVIACDGSQIMPSQHEVYSCYLLNIGISVFSYRTQTEPLLHSLPTLFHEPEHLYPLINRRRVHIDESVVSLERTLLELGTAFKYSKEAKDRALPVVSLLDGSLIPWGIDKMPDSYQKEYIERLELILDDFNNNEIPLLGYISHSRSSDIVNNLRVFNCPYPSSHCQTFCANLDEESYPCSNIWPLSDRQLLKTKLAKASRSHISLSGSTWSRTLTKLNQITFCYLHTGGEVARIELPFWLFEKKDQLNFALQTIISQTEKGFGYPISLAEAHHLAIIRQQDRTRFFELVTSQLIASGASHISVSPKESGKRHGIV